MRWPLASAKIYIYTYSEPFYTRVGVDLVSFLEYKKIVMFVPIGNLLIHIA